MIAWRLIHLAETPSTNAALRAQAEEGAPEGTVITADHQTAGRGRFERVWEDELGASLLFSLLLRPRGRDADLPLYSFLASLAVAEALERYPGVRTSLRWPNDIDVDGRKVCGILLERAGTALIMGIGINVNQSSFPPTLPSAVSLRMVTLTPVDRSLLLDTVLERVGAWAAAVAAQGFAPLLAAWRRRCAMWGKPVTVHAEGAPWTGVATGLAEDGGLMIDTSGGQQTVYAGDVTIRMAS